MQPIVHLPVPMMNAEAANQPSQGDANKDKCTKFLHSLSSVSGRKMTIETLTVPPEGRVNKLNNW